MQKEARCKTEKEQFTKICFDYTIDYVLDNFATTVMLPENLV
jgi:hypothetical protein